MHIAHHSTEPPSRHVALQFHHNTPIQRKFSEIKQKKNFYSNLNWKWPQNNKLMLGIEEKKYPKNLLIFRTITCNNGICFIHNLNIFFVCM